RAAAHSHLLYALHFDPRCDAAALACEHRQWQQRHAAPLRAAIFPHTNDRSPDRRLRIGYVSGALREHVIGRNLLPLLREHDRGEFEAVYFSDVGVGDSITARFRALAAQWQETAQLDHEKLAALIRREKIDILVDLAQHLGGEFNRLPV